MKMEYDKGRWYGRENTTEVKLGCAEGSGENPPPTKFNLIYPYAYRKRPSTEGRFSFNK
jgi:hypothetical protein